MTISIGIDIGGTFTDVVVLDQDGERYFGKALTTYDDPAKGVFEGVTDALSQAGKKMSDATSIIHGTTLVTNALIERKGAMTALITTKGFRDSTEIGTESRYDLFDLSIDKPEPLVPRRLRYGVEERVLVDGSLLTPLNEDDVRAVVKEIVAKGVSAVAVCLLHSYANPKHERRIRDIINELAPSLRVSISSEVSPEIREYPRASTTIANVFVQGLVEKYLQDLKNGLTQAGFNGELLIMLSGGGTSTIETASRLPIGLLESGPVGGAVAAGFHSREQQLGNLLVFDMGGTTAKLSLLEKGHPTLVHEFEVARAHRFKKGSGFPIKIPVVDMIEIGAGGGSIARMDRTGRLKVGPDSAGSEPGPVCYGRGGVDPTVTDANLVLGYLDPDFFLGGKMNIDVEGARRAIEEKIAKPMGLTVTEAASGILQLVAENMANAARIHAAERGKDLRTYSMFAFGGAGPLQACQLAKSLRIQRIIIASGAGVLSAFGFLTVPVAFDFSRTIRGEINSLDWDRVNEALREMAAEGRKVLAQCNYVDADLNIVRTCEARYRGQSHEITIGVPQGNLGPEHAAVLQRNFVSQYRELYNYDEGSGETLSIEALTWRVRVAGPAPDVRIRPKKLLGEVATTKKKRLIYSHESRNFVEAPVLDRYKLPAGFELTGPLIVEERESTLVVPDRATLRVDQHMNLIVVLND